MKTFQLHIASVGLAALAFTGLASAEDVTGAGSSCANRGSGVGLIGAHARENNVIARR